MSLQPIILRGDASFEMSPVACTADYLELEVYLCSEKYDHLDVAFEYRVTGTSTWQTDAVLVGDSGQFSADNRVYGMAASVLGARNLIRWAYPSSLIARGSQCDLRLVILPSLRVFSTTVIAGAEEQVGLKSNVVGYFGSFTPIGRDLSGNYMGLDEGVFTVKDTTGNTLMTYEFFEGSVFAQQKLDGNYLVLDVFNSTLNEVYPDGNLFTYYEFSPISHFCFDELTKNIVVVAPNSPKIYEVSWGDSIGDVVWQSDAVSDPRAVTYAFQNSSTLIVTDFDAGTSRFRIVSLNRNQNPIVPVVIDGVTVDAQANVRFSELFIPVSFADGSIGLVEKNGMSEVYAATPASHPSLMRSRFNNSTPTGVNAVNAYRNLLFAPLKQGMVE